MINTSCYILRMDIPQCLARKSPSRRTLRQNAIQIPRLILTRTESAQSTCGLRYTVYQNNRRKAQTVLLPVFPYQTGDSFSRGYADVPGIFLWFRRGVRLRLVEIQCDKCAIEEKTGYSQQDSDTFQETHCKTATLGRRTAEQGSHLFHLAASGNESCHLYSSTVISPTHPSHAISSGAARRKARPERSRSMLFDRRICSRKHRIRDEDFPAALASLEKPAGSQACIWGKSLVVS